MLWDAIRVRASGDDDKELALMQRALDMGLSEADAAFARGMIAETTPDAVDQFKEAIEHDPFHHRATSALVGVLLSLGRLSEVRQYATLGHLLFPDDPNFPLMLGCAAALEGDWTTAKRAIDEDCNQLDEPTRTEMLAIARFLFDMRDFDLLASGPITYFKGLSAFLRRCC